MGNGAFGWEPRIEGAGGRDHTIDPFDLSQAHPKKVDTSRGPHAESYSVRWTFFCVAQVDRFSHQQCTNLGAVVALIPSCRLSSATKASDLIMQV